MSGAVGSIPSLMRRGRPSFNLAISSSSTRISSAPRLISASATSSWDIFDSPITIPQGQTYYWNGGPIGKAVNSDLLPGSTLSASHGPLARLQLSPSLAPQDGAYPEHHGDDAGGLASEQAVATRVDDNDNELAVEQQVDEEAQLARAEPVTPPKPRYVTRQVKVRSGDNMGSSSSAWASAPRICTSSTSSRARIPCACSSPVGSSPSSSPRAASCTALLPHSLEQALKVNRRDDGFVARPVKIELDTREQVAQGKSAPASGRRRRSGHDGRPDHGSRRHLRLGHRLCPGPATGDSFRVVYQDKYQDDERVASGDILAAEFVNQGPSTAPC